MMKRATLTLFSVAVALGFSGCVSGDGMVRVPRVPEWRQPAAAQTYTAAQVQLECWRLAPQAALETSDAVFTPLNHEWMTAALDWSWHFAKAIGFAYVVDATDCEDYALGVAFAANVAAGRAGVKAQPLLARIYVHQLQAFGGVPAGGGHALNAFYSDRAPHIWVFDPQTRVLVPFSEYPNRQSIFSIKIGG